MELEYSNYVEKLIQFWSENIRDNCYKINTISQLDVKEYVFLLKEAEKGNLLGWLNSKDSYLAYIVLIFFISKMIYVKKKYYKNDQKAILFMEMGLENYINNLNTYELMTILTPYIYSEDLKQLSYAKELINSKVNVIDNKIKIYLFRIDSRIKILTKFNRYPERNQDLNRISTEDEIDYLDILDI